MKESAKISGKKFDDGHSEFELSGPEEEVVCLFLQALLYVARSTGIEKEYLGRILIDLPDEIVNDVMSMTMTTDFSNVPDALELIKQIKESDQ